MKKPNLLIAFATLLAILAVGGCAGTYDPGQPAGYAPAAYGTDESDFYSALAPYGDWIRSNRYGLVEPVRQAGRLAPLHRRRMGLDRLRLGLGCERGLGLGHLSIRPLVRRSVRRMVLGAGREWAPAWVAWREGGGWVGWAPLPPELAWGNGGWQGNNDWDRLPGVEHYWWSFCRDRDLPGPGIIRRLAPRHRAVVLIGETRNVTDYTMCQLALRQSQP
ncbi:MAG: hypothetical protein IPG61_09750 [bacterium]|nr:hypothetical protein [bacterium]